MHGFTPSLLYTKKHPATSIRHVIHTTVRAAEQTWLCVQEESTCKLPSDTGSAPNATQAHRSCSATAAPPGTAVCSTGTAWHICDMRAGDVAQTYAEAHSEPILSTHVAPSAPHLVARGGQDCTSRVWDLRCVSGPRCCVGCLNGLASLLGHAPFMHHSCRSQSNSCSSTVLH